MFKATSSLLEKPVRLARTKDALLSSATASHFRTSGNDLDFIVRKPSSVIPPAFPLQNNTISSTNTTADSTGNLFLQSPLGAQLFSSTTSSSPVPSTSSAPSPPPPSLSSRPHLTPSEIASLQTLRRSNPSYWTRSRLAEKFQLSSPSVVGLFGWGEGREGKAAEKERREEVEAERRRKEGKWGWRKAIAREERKRRREMW
ncbi:hypothetical protein T439DRAFT_92156 [Meredithblackwellia eburnea MCA 4105]